MSNQNSKKITTFVVAKLNNAGVETNKRTVVVQASNDAANGAAKKVANAAAIAEKTRANAEQAAVKAKKNINNAAAQQVAANAAKKAKEAEEKAAEIKRVTEETQAAVEAELLRRKREIDRVATEKEKTDIIKAERAARAAAAEQKNYNNGFKLGMAEAEEQALPKEENQSRSNLNNYLSGLSSNIRKVPAAQPKETTVERLKRLRKKVVAANPNIGSTLPNIVKSTLNGGGRRKKTQHKHRTQKKSRKQRKQRKH